VCCVCMSTAAINAKRIDHLFFVCILEMNHMEISS